MNILRFLLWLVLWPLTIIGDKNFSSRVRPSHYLLGILGLLLAFEFAGVLGVHFGISPWIFMFMGILLYLIAGLIPYLEILSGTVLSE